MLTVIRNSCSLFIANICMKCYSQPPFFLPFNKCRRLSTSISKFPERRGSASSSLPQLPIPDLDQTLDKYLRSVQPFLSPEELKETENLVLEFRKDGGVGEKLQEFLKARAEKKDNWLSEWWLECAYLGYRSPVTVWSSPGLVYPFRTFNSVAEQLTYASNVIAAALSYRQKIDRNEIPQDMSGKDPLDMSQYKKIFGTSRIPRPHKDELSMNPSSNHIIIMHNNNFFRLNTLDDNNNLLEVDEFYDNLLAAIENSMSKEKPVGILTSENRDTWAKCYEILEKNPENLASLKEIKTSLFVVCLDNVCSLDKNSNNKTKAAYQTVHGGGSKCNGGNRWFDKTIQFIINRGGEVGLTYEHSPAEGQPIAVMTDYIVDNLENNYVNVDTSATRNLPLKLKKLQFVISPELDEYVGNAAANLDKVASDLDMSCFTYEKYGKNFIKRHKLSPDSYIQMAQQCAFYKLHMVPGAHYESAATRKFLHGRTETIRSCSNESVEFAKKMLDKSASDVEKLKFLINAINAHKKYATEAASGYGVDRHFLGLKLAAKELGIELPKIFTDAGFLRSSHMRISTSQVAAKCDAFMCYGPLVEDGYACCYNPRGDTINFAIAAFKSGKETDAARFHQYLENTLNDMQHLLSLSKA